jgi:hypothetical protein
LRSAADVEYIRKTQAEVLEKGFVVINVQTMDLGVPVVLVPMNLQKNARSEARSGPDWK